MGWMGFTWIYTNYSRIQLLVFNGFHINFPAISLDVLAPIHRENHRKSDGLIWQNHRHHDPGISPWYHISLSQSHDSLLLCSSFPCFCYNPMVLEPSPLNPSFKIWVCQKSQTISPLVALVHRHFPHISIVILGRCLSWSENSVPYFPHQNLGVPHFETNKKSLDIRQKWRAIHESSPIHWSSSTSLASVDGRSSTRAMLRSTSSAVGGSPCTGRFPEAGNKRSIGIDCFNKIRRNP